ncbi:MAG: hypothetical protein K2I70_04835 [Bacilli bacterium]|nr:hypothetical protein [Bacilli bacterium]
MSRIVIDDKFNELINRGFEVIPEYLHGEWESFINKYKEIDVNAIGDYLEECNIVTSYLVNFRISKDSRLVADKFYEEFSYKSNYTKKLANSIAKFAQYPDNIRFLQRYYERFQDITEEEERTLTRKIDELKSLNSIIKAGANYEEATYLNKPNTKTIDINGQIISLVEWESGLYYGISDDNEFVIYKCMEDEFDVVYLIRETGTYTRLISRRQRFERGNMFSSKTLTTDQDNNILSIDYNEILEKYAFHTIEEVFTYYQRIKDKTSKINRKELFTIMKELADLDSMIDENNHKLVFAIFDKMTKDLPTKDVQTK